jgi:ribosome biogenesis GTPase A
MVEAPPSARRIVLVGNPNTGKSVFFNALTGLYVDVSNFPGTTVEVSQGRWGEDLIVDTPGIYGVASFNDEERVARDIIVKADLVVIQSNEWPEAYRNRFEELETRLLQAGWRPWYEAGAIDAWRRPLKKE